jgi:hypothetical protein
MHEPIYSTDVTPPLSIAYNTLYADSSSNQSLSQFPQVEHLRLKQVNYPSNTQKLLFHRVHRIFQRMRLVLLGLMDLMLRVSSRGQVSVGIE